MFGPKAEKQAWLLAQHADNDPEFQSGCLTLIEPLVSTGETEKEHYALLFDRVALAKGEKQRYGTQVDVANGKVTIHPYESSLDELEARRKQMGMLPLNEYIEMVENAYSARENNKE